MTPTAEERRKEYYRRFDPLAVVGPELHKHGGYDPENEGGQRDTGSKGGHDTDLRSYLESRFQQIDLKIDKLLAADRVPPVPVPPVPPVPVVPQPTWSPGHTPTPSPGYTRNYAVKTFRTYFIIHEEF